MKTRWRIRVEQGSLLICDKYPNCECKGHLVYEENKELKKGDEK